LYKKFEKLLKEKKVTAYRVAKEINITASTFTDWKNGRSTPKIEKLKKIANYFKVPIEYFLVEGNEQDNDYKN